ncbi:hypothetical protein ACHHYP_17121 [Achlya hypogyna]|uniref:Uncharacterized protein n=1 Tax=Achlya hypogyna TaxID=1202772 RepID=A0A1V9Y597_ACHHY|nr:hypothetical protein ACHHYP_17121 [Achlya hypogyna]
MAVHIPSKPSDKKQPGRLKSWWKRLLHKRHPATKTPVVPLPAKYANESNKMTVVGGKPVPFLPKQVASMKARKSVDDLGPIDELKEGIQPKKADAPEPIAASTTMAFMMSTAM